MTRRPHPVQHDGSRRVPGRHEIRGKHRGANIREEGRARRVLRHRGGGTNGDDLGATPRGHLEHVTNLSAELARAQLRERGEREVQIDAEPALVRRARRGRARRQALHRRDLTPGERPREHLRRRHDRVVQKLELPEGRVSPRRSPRDGAHGKGFLVLHRPGEHSRDGFERDAVGDAETLVVQRGHRVGPVEVRRRLPQRVHGVFVVPRSRGRRSGGWCRDAHGGGQGRQGLAALGDVQRAVRPREHPDEPREFPLVHRGHEPHHLLHVLLARGAPVAELLDHHRGARAGRQTAHNIAAGIPHRARRV